jgi:hypothetical protein
MATYTHKIAPSSSDQAGLFVVRGRLSGPELAKRNQGVSFSNGDDVIIATIPAGALVLSGYYKISTGEGASQTIDVGYSAGGTDNLTNLDIQTAGTWTIMTDPNFNSDDFDERSSDTDIYVQMDTVVASAVVDFMWICVMGTDQIIDNA